MRTTVLAAALVLAACGGEPPVTRTAWKLETDLSTVGYVSIKAGDFAETNAFGRVVGRVEPTGEARISIDLDTVETNVDIRNERMRKVFFKTKTYPEAVVTLALDPAALQELGVGDRVRIDAPLTLALHGETAEYDAAMFVTRASADRVTVDLVRPILVDAREFGLENGLNELMALAGLPSITPTAPVTASLVFTRADD
ncbi:MAG: YceI family protein [Pseudomonadota bacterium]